MGKVELRGWKSICNALDVKDRKTALKILKRRYFFGHCVLEYDGRTPVVSVTALQNGRRKDDKN